MATLERLRDQSRHALSARDLVGRSRTCDLRVEAPFVSSEHAVLQWDAAGWELRDLGSRNGSFVDGVRVEPGQNVVLAEGATLEFGGEEERWRVVDLGAPVALARPDDAGAAVSAEDGLLALPSAERPEATVFLRHGAIWILERDGIEEAVVDRAVVTAGGVRWVLRLPELFATTEGLTPRTTGLEEPFALRFRVSGDEEHVELSVRVGEREVDLGAKAHHHVLLNLARARLRDQSEGGHPATSHGWLYQDDLANMLAIDEPRVNVDIYRARKQFAKVGVAANALVERRPGTRQLRVGTAMLEVTAL